MKQQHPIGRLLAATTLLLVCSSWALADKPVTDDDMRRVYNEVKTPYKYGVVLAPDDKDAEYFDCPNVFRYGDKWYMLYVSFKNKVGYETCLAQSDDLLKWKPLGKVLPFADE